MNSAQQNRSILFKNTVFLYIRTLLVMLISLYTSRIVLSVLGIDDFGIYNVVGGIVAMFSVITSALSTSISRFLTFEIGKDNLEKQKIVFSTSINIQIIFSFIIIVLGGFIGGWFLNTYMNIPTERVYASNWVFACALFTFVLNLLSIPYNACIIAHEKMSAFAYISVLDAILKLLIVFNLKGVSIDKLIVYAILLLFEALLIRLIYGIYCRLHFPESRYEFILDKILFREMTGFAGWNFFTNCAYIFNTQGMNILINMYFGVSTNAARGIAVQMETAIKKFVTDFTTAINPQITKNYAQQNMNEVYTLVCMSSRFSFFLLFFMGLPLLLETPIILKLWLNNIPEHTITFFRLSLIGTMLDTLGGPLYTASMATGTIKKYVLYVTSITCWAFPLTWLFFHMSFPVETCYIIMACLYTIVLFVKLHLTKGLIGLPICYYFKDVVLKILIVIPFSVLLPLFINIYFDCSIKRLIVVAMTSMISCAISIFFWGLNTNEKQALSLKFNKIFK